MAEPMTPTEILALAKRLTLGHRRKSDILSAADILTADAALREALDEREAFWHRERTHSPTGVWRASCDGHLAEITKIRELLAVVSASRPPAGREREE